MEVVTLTAVVLPSNNSSSLREVDINSHPSNSSRAVTVVNRSRVSTASSLKDTVKHPLLPADDLNRASMLHPPVAHLVSRAATLHLLVRPHLASNSSMDSRDMASKVNLVNSRAKGNMDSSMDKVKDSTDSSRDKELLVASLPSSMDSNLPSTRLHLDRVVLQVAVTAEMPASSSPSYSSVSRIKTSRHSTLRDRST